MLKNVRRGSAPHGAKAQGPRMRPAGALGEVMIKAQEY